MHRTPRKPLLAISTCRSNKLAKPDFAGCAEAAAMRRRQRAAGPSGGRTHYAGRVATEDKQDAVTMDKIVALCKRRGFLFQSSEIYGGLGSAYDYGHYGVLLKTNVKSEWWRAMIQERDD